MRALLWMVVAYTAAAGALTSASAAAAVEPYTQLAAPAPPTAAPSTEPELASQNPLGATAVVSPIGADPGRGFVRLPGHIPGAVARSTLLPESHGPDPRMTLTIVFNRKDEAGFQRYLREVNDPASPNHGDFLSQAKLTARFGPSPEAYRDTLRYLRAQGFRLVQGSKNRMTLTVSGSRPAVEHAFKIAIHNYHVGDSDAYANDSDPALPTALASRVQAIDGLSNFSLPRPIIKTWVYQNICSKEATAAARKKCRDLTNATYDEYRTAICDLGPIALSGGGYYAGNPYVLATGVIIAIACSVQDLSGGAATVIRAANQPGGPNALGNARAAPDTTLNFSTGAGQTIGLLEFDAFNSTDVSDYLAYIGASASLLNNLTTKAVNGGVATPGADESEVLVDIDTVLTLAPGAHVVVYEAPFGGSVTSYTSVFNAMINDGVTIISNSWASCEDQVSVAEAQSVDSIFQTAAASGITVFNGTGDSGSTCLDGSAGTISVPADSPNATAVGGTSWPQGLGPGRTYGAETWWDGSSSDPPTGQGGFGVSRYFAKPSYQGPLSAGSMRSIPDVVVRADPANGVIICQADAGGCPNGGLYGGTSLAAPSWAAITALLNQKLGKPLGALNTRLYTLAATDAFHNAASMNSDFQHVGLGSPNVNVLARLLSGQTSAGTPDGGASIAVPMYQPAAVTFTGPTSFTVPADGTSQGGVLAVLLDADGNTVSGKTVTLTANGGHAVITPASGVSTVSNGAVAFTVTDLTAESVNLTATDTTDGVALAPVTLMFGVPPAASGGISANPSALPADGQTAATVVVTLKDSLNRPTPGKMVTLADGGAHAVLTGATPGVTDANGQIQFAATDQVNETVTFTAVDITDGNLAIPGSAEVTYSDSIFSSCGVGVPPTAGPGYTITPFITGLPAAPSAFLGGVNATCPGGSGPTFTSSGAVLVSDSLTGGIYQLGPDGGAASSSTLLNVIAPFLSGLVYGKDGSAYATVGNVGGEIIRVDPATGAQLAVVASGLTCPAGLSVDPLSGDLFFDDECTGGGLDDASIWRVIDPANTNPSMPTSVVVYATLPTTPNGLMAFAPNGTLYAVSGYFVSPNAQVEQVSPTSATAVTVTPVNGVTSDYAVAIGKTNADGSAQSLIAEPAGTLSEIPIADPAAAVVLGTGSPGVGVVGPDGCMYTAHYDTVYRLANSTGPCTFAPTSPAPAMGLSPVSVTPSPAQGSSQTFTAKVQNVTPRAGVPVFFSVSGANPQVRLVPTDANGDAAFTYTASFAGADMIFATASANGTPLRSNSANITWATGRDLAFLTLNLSPQGGTVGQPVTVVASLSDVTQSTPAAGESVTFTLGTATCTATSDKSGNARCALTPARAGAVVLNARFAGTSQLTAGSDSAAFNVLAAATPPPTVTIAVRPTDVAAGSPATLTWSSTGATACAASGSWSGSKSTVGTQTVTPATTGSFTYTLTCAGSAGSAVASAVLSATLVNVSVTAKSGGGAMSLSLELLLGILVMMRLAPALRRRKKVGSVDAALLLCAAALSVGSGSARAQAGAAATAPSWLDPFYIGVRVGDMPVRLNAGKLDAGLDASGFSGVTAATDTSAPAGTLYIGYELAPHADLEFGYTYRNSRVATLSGTLASAASVPALLQETTRLVRGYGNIFSLSWRAPVEIAPRITIEPRAGAFVWDTQVRAVSDGANLSATHRGGGLTAGVGLAYRVWRGLRIGVGADFFRGSPNNIATLYGGSLEWSFAP